MTLEEALRQAFVAGADRFTVKGPINAALLERAFADAADEWLEGNYKHLERQLREKFEIEPTQPVAINDLINAAAEAEARIPYEDLEEHCKPPRMRAHTAGGLWLQDIVRVKETGTHTRVSRRLVGKVGKVRHLVNSEARACLSLHSPATGTNYEVWVHIDCLERVPESERLPRDPDSYFGTVSNCALAHREDESTCQMCKGNCPDLPPDEEVL
jgi:hypothetical protein